MEIEEVVVRIAPFIRKYWLPLLLATLGLIFFGYGLISLFMTKSPSNSEFSQDVSQPSLASVSPVIITVDIEGAVVLPGVYKLPMGSIVQDVLIAARGLAQDANRDFVAKNINLAQKINDSQKIYIPHLNDQVIEEQNQTSTVQNSTNSLININTASATELDSLPGIGPVTAQKIISNRPYATANDLLSKGVVSSKVFTEIQNKITTY